MRDASPTGLGDGTGPGPGDGTGPAPAAPGPPPNRMFPASCWRLCRIARALLIALLKPVRSAVIWIGRSAERRNPSISRLLSSIDALSAVVSIFGTSDCAAPEPPGPP